ncbi:MAG TPA: DMT family transporter [Acidimicrobiia bacterium]|nr:DMT family transporter [Acidimicrobiia bacterium]
MTAPRTVRNETGLGYLAVLLVVFLWGIGPLFVRAVDASALTIAAARNWVALPVAFGIAWLAKATINWRVLRVAIPGGLAFACAQTLGFASFHETSLANAAIISALSPLVIVIVAVPLFGERLTSRQVLLMACAFAGVLAVVLGAEGGGGASMFGDLLAFGSLFAMTGYLLLMKHARMSDADIDAAAYVAGVFLVCAIVVTPVDLIWGDSLAAVTEIDWLWIVLLAVLAGCLGHTFMTWAQRHVNVGVASIMVLGTTVVTAAGGWVFFDQALTAVQIVGGMIVLIALSGVLLLQLSDPALPPEVPVLVELAESPLAE